MTQIKAEYPIDLHTHTMASAHAYSTVTENARAAAERGLAVMAVTDHASHMQDAPHKWHFRNIHRIPPELFGVRILLGAELNLLDFDGRVDLTGRTLEAMDLCIASLHPSCLRPETAAKNTAALLGAMENPKVFIIGHPNYEETRTDLRQLAKRAAECGVALELNNSSLKRERDYEQNRENAREMLAYCKEYGTHISLGSDAHFWTEVGDFAEAKAFLEEAAFPEELIVCSSMKRLDAFLAERRSIAGD